MIHEFPYTITAPSGTMAEITKPEVGHYHFNVITPINTPGFDFFTPEYKGPGKKADEVSHTTIENEILEIFWTLER